MLHKAPMNSRSSRTVLAIFDLVRASGGATDIGRCAVPCTSSTVFALGCGHICEDVGRVLVPRRRFRLPSALGACRSPCKLTQVRLAGLKLLCALSEVFLPLLRRWWLDSLVRPVWLTDVDGCVSAMRQGPLGTNVSLACGGSKVLDRVVA